MNWKKEWKTLAAIVAVFLISYYLPIGKARFDQAIFESLKLVKWYAREHVILCLVPAFFIAGAVGVFVSQASVMKYLGAKANKFLAYGVASVSGSILAVCSCTVLPLFSGIYKMGAGLGPATAFLYSGPAINVLAIVLTARVLGVELGIARALGAIIFSVVIGLLMHLIFIKEETAKAATQIVMPEEEKTRPLWQTAIYFASMVGILVFANWAPTNSQSGIWYSIFTHKWQITGAFAILLAISLTLWFEIKLRYLIFAAIPAVILAIVIPKHPEVAFVSGVLGLAVLTANIKGENQEWFNSSWGFAKQILPLLLLGVLIAGFLLGSSPETDGIIPSEWVSKAVGGNSFSANLFASVAGAFMYFATLTEVPILEGLISNGMGKGPALALLLAGPALSLPNMLVIRSVMGTTKTIVYVSLVIVMATFSGIIYGAFF
jgi:uncharacterized membrane protein YraQ (UPF0718 family)